MANELTHRDCGGHYTVVGLEFVSEDYPDVEVFRCDRCKEHTMQPDAVEFDDIPEEMR